MSGSAIISKNLAVGGDTTLAGLLTVNSDATFVTPVTMKSTLDVSGATALASTLAVGGNTTLAGSLTVNSDAIFATPVTMQSTLGVTGASAFVGAVNIDGLLTASNIQVIGSFMTVNAIETHSSNLVVDNKGTGVALQITQENVASGQAVASFYAGAAPALYVTSDAYVAVGQTSAIYSLDVSGTLGVSGVSTLVGAVAVGDTFAPLFSLDVSGSAHITEQSVIGAAGSVVDPSGALLRVAGNTRVDGTIAAGNVTDLDGTSFVRENETLWFEGAVQFLHDNGVASTSLNVGAGGSVTCRYMHLGSLVTAEIAVKFGAGAELGTSTSPWNFTLPIVPGGSFHNNNVGSAFIVNAISANYTAAVVGNSTSGTNPHAVSIYMNMSTNGIVGTDFQWSEGDTLNMNVTYESETRTAVIPPLTPFTVDSSGNVYMAGNMQFFSAAHLQASSYAPVWSASTTAPALGDGTLTGSYSQIGNFVTANVTLAVGSTTNLGVGTYTFSLPVVASAPKSSTTAWLTAPTGAITVVLASVSGPTLTLHTSSGALLSDTVGGLVPGTTLTVDITYSVSSFPIVAPQSSVMLQTDATNVGIGMAPTIGLPTSSLEVAGSIYATTGSVTTTAVYATSDRRLKSNIEPLVDSLSKIQQLAGVSFTLDATAQDSIGLIAQDVQAVLPQVVQANDQGFLSLNYGALVGLLVEGIKDISARLTALEASP